ncbi:monovalent cation/H+ antiporter complex subunit F [Propionibacteriaceae bacterium Y2011]|uniref:monovalent cation/H+ antiporter complex subunit F n=1 Tax=Microlunatus sp. Y2014 TaxID=3418488 RepID=UPI003B49B5F1
MIVSILLGLGVVMLAAAALLALYRMTKGPTTLDRIISADVILAMVVAGLTMEAVINRHATTLPIMLVVSLVAFAGSLSAARFFADQDRNTLVQEAHATSDAAAETSDGETSDGETSDGEGRAAR